MATTFSSRRLENIRRNQELLEELGAAAQAKVIQESAAKSSGRQQQRKPIKRTRNEPLGRNSQPTRVSARIAAAAVDPAYDHDSASSSEDSAPAPRKRQKTATRRPRKTVAKTATQTLARSSGYSEAELDELRASWSAWQPVAGAPTRDDAGVFHFDSHSDFTPNKSPAELLREGAFGGSYFRPLYSKKLGITISDDYLELPKSWYEGLDCSYYLTSSTYDPEANKFKVACGQSIEEWEASGWINHQFDVRGWFQWYCRFFQGRRCDDDERQISRWKKCVGSTGRWRRMLLKKYVALGVRTVWDDGEDEDAPEVSPVMHQTCHHWAFEVTQDVLDRYWKTGM
ncbi:hypothetical protein BD289DRAFT_360312 [Coniella lustricola]|uniref:Vegetatible incompatibility protein HET-E-1 n=1 Tax=Coniella lustricola TaxID=2025994 RepID=A0A2T3AJV0_9PEZI|nr:hypothetical protein BD289DRAFT_360312 [Coniella lustricola]